VGDLEQLTDAEGVGDGQIIASPLKTTRDAILDAAQTLFAHAGYEGTSLNDIAKAVGIRRPSLLHHFESKEALYQATFERHVADWFSRIEDSTLGSTDEWETLDRILETAFSFFSANPEFVRIVRWEMLAEESMLGKELGEQLRPLMNRAQNFFQRGMDSGRFRHHDPEQLLLTGYGAILSSFSDVVFLATLMQRDPLSVQALRERYNHLRAFFRSALEPVATGRSIDVSASTESKS
jgi:TetR/AcrR family transcriptional regulator